MYAEQNTQHTHTHKSSHVRLAGRTEQDQIHLRSRNNQISILHAAVSLRRDKGMPAPPTLAHCGFMMKNGFVIGCKPKKKRQMRSSFQHTEVHSSASHLKQSSAKVLFRTDTWRQKEKRRCHHDTGEANRVLQVGLVVLKVDGTGV